jgi:OmpA-OmpF porin, OOP family
MIFRQRACLVLCAALLASASHAQTNALPAFDLERMELNPSGLGAWTVGSGQVLPVGDYRGTALLHYEHNPLLAVLDGVRIGSIVRHRMTLHLAAAYSPYRHLELGLLLPVIGFQTGDDLRTLGVPSAAAAGLGTPVLGVRYQLLRSNDGAPFDLAAGLGIGLPVGSDSAFGRNPGLSVMPKLMGSRGFLHLLGSAEVGALIRPGSPVGTQALGSHVSLGAAVSTLGPSWRGELSIHSAISLTQLPVSFEVRAGPRYPVSSSFDLFALAGLGFGSAPGTPNFRLMVGGSYGGSAGVSAPPKVICSKEAPHRAEDCPELDDDSDGIKNGADVCSLEAEDKDAFEDTDGCPEADNDSDSFLDPQDRCPNEKGVAEHGGCPPPDQDNDGVLDAVDACPTEYGLARRKGCPFKDDDDDGLENTLDACPSEAGILETRGCAPKDTDGDGVQNHKDNCPDAVGPESNQGCPAKQKQLVVITREKLLILDKVYFEANKSRLLPKSFKMLNQIASVLDQHPDILKVVIEGHTDPTGDAQQNKRLSQERAEAVRNFLISKGVAPERLEAQGHGSEKPQEDNSTLAGREANRRVEFVIPVPDAE